VLPDRGVRFICERSATAPAWSRVARGALAAAETYRPSARGRGLPDRHLQCWTGPFSSRLPCPGGLCRPTYRNGRSASYIRTAAQLAHVPLVQPRKVGPQILVRAGWVAGSRAELTRWMGKTGQQMLPCVLSSGRRGRSRAGRQMWPRRQTTACRPSPVRKAPCDLFGCSRPP
jgi:hypothetical protein